MYRLVWLVPALLVSLSLTPGAAQTRDRSACLDRADRNTLAACGRYIEELSRTIRSASTGKLPPRDRQRQLYDSYTLRGGAYQAMARRYAADLDPQKATELHRRAIADFDEAIRLDRSQLHAFINRGSSRAEIFELDGAIEDFEEVLRLESKNPVALNNLGGAYGDRGDYPRAIAELDRAIGLNPRYADALANRGSIHLQKEEYDRAIADFSAALIYGAHDVYVWSARGRAWRDKGNDKRAMADFKAALAAPAPDKQSAAVQDAVRELLRALQEKAEREEAARRQKAELERIEQELVEREKAELRKAELERLEREKAEKAALAAAEKAAREKVALEKVAQERVEREKAAREKSEREREARERARLEKSIREQAERERVELEKAAREKAAREKAEQAARQRAEKIDQEKTTREKAIRDREEREKAKREKTRAGRILLAIGNSAYPVGGLGKLKNPRNDAEAVARAFEALDFTVLRGFDLDGAQTADLLARFMLTSRAAETVVFFFAGHGLTYGGDDYLAPIDANQDNIGTFTNLQSLVVELQGGHGVRILIIDACRTRAETEVAQSPARPTGRSAILVRGLGRVEQRTLSGDMFVAYAAGPGEAAEDGVRSNSPFTSALVKHLHTPGLELHTLFTRVRQEVFADTKGRQKPQIASQLLQEGFHLVPPPVARAQSITPVPRPARSPESR